MDITATIPRQEKIHRRVPRTWASSPNDLPSLSTFLPRGASKIDPSDLGDVDGLSTSRDSITDASKLHTHKGKKFHVATLPADTLIQNDVRVFSDPQDWDEGHCLLPEMNITDYKGNKKTWIKERAEVFRSRCTLTWNAEAADHSGG